jgi:CSLREA domain-containing protein
MTPRRLLPRRVLAAVAVLAGAALPVLAAVPARAATTWVVTSTADTGGSCGPGACTLRAAIAAANGSAGADLISFNVAPGGPQTITVGAGAALALPSVKGDDITIDGTTQPGGGAHGIRLDDPDPDGGESGLIVDGQRAVIRGLVVTGFDTYGISLRSTAHDAVIQGNLVGTPDGVTARGTANDGIHVKSGGGHRIGGGADADRNVVSGSAKDGIELEDSSDNVVAGNYVGVTADGVGRLPNVGMGIRIDGVSLRNRVGGLSAGERNVVSGNNGIGVQILGSMRTDGTCETPQANQVQGNYLGVNVNGTKPSGGTHGNFGEGVQLSTCARDNLVGGATPGARNVISGNRADGVELDSSGGPGGTAAVCGNTVQGNYIGSDPTGTAPVPNSDDGVGIDNGACGNLVGGAETGAGNLIGGNFNDGIDISRPGSSDNTVQGNVIGLAADGSNVLRNTQNGVHLRNRAARNLVVGNTISGNLQSGVLVEQAMTDANSIRDNRIGTSTSGSAVRGNKQYGIWIYDGAQRTLVQGDRVEGSTLDGIAVERSAAATAATVSNRITRTTTRGNGGLGIDLLPADGPNPNDGNNAQATVGNTGLDPPVITGATAASVPGTAPAGAVVEVFAAAPGSGETNGEGAAYLGAASADAAGRWCLAGIAAGGSVTATATATGGDTSEFSANLATAGTADLCATTAATQPNG